MATSRMIETMRSVFFFSGLLSLGIRILWDVVERAFCSMKVYQKNLQELSDAIMPTWTKISKEHFLVETSCGIHAINEPREAPPTIRSLPNKVLSGCPSANPQHVFFTLAL